MKKLCKAAIPAAMLAVVMLVGFVQLMPAQVFVGTTGACNNQSPGGPCTQTSTLVQLNSKGKLIKVVGPVGFTVNGLAWDNQSQKLYASTAIGDVTFHGLITINLKTGVGTPVDKNVVNFGLTGDPSPIHSITIDSFGNMAGWYDEFGPGVTDTFVQINKNTGVATEFTNTGIDTSQNGLSFNNFNQLWNIDTSRIVNNVLTQTAYLIDSSNGKPISSTPLSPPTSAALGDFNPVNNLYYGLDFTGFGGPTTFLVVVDPSKGTVTTLGRTVDNLHVIAFTKSGQ
jgi:hypothetical protein